MANTADNRSTTSTVGLDPISTMARASLETYERTLGLVQDWSSGMLASYREQAEAYSAMLTSFDKSLRAMEQVLESQEQARKALADSLDASRQAVAAALKANQHSEARVETLVGNAVGVIDSQLDAVRAQVALSEKIMSGQFPNPSSSPFLTTSQEWVDAYARLLGQAGRSTAPSAGD